MNFKPPGSWKGAIAGVLGLLVVGALVWAPSWLAGRAPGSAAPRSQAASRASPSPDVEPGPPAAAKPRAQQPAPASQAALASAQPLPPPGTPLTVMYESLKKLADGGDARAACRLAFELDRCRTLDVMRKGPINLREASRKFPLPWSEGEIARRVAEMEQRNARLEVVCKDFPEEQTLAAWDYGLAAALAGNREARWLVSSIPLGLDFERPENTLEGWAEWRRYIPRILQEGVEAGDPRMFSLASRAYHLPSFGFQIFPADPVRATAFRMALQARASNGYRATADRDVSFSVDSFGLTAEEQQRARTLAATLPPLTGIPADGIDWSRGMAPDRDGSECEKP
jgi:hypothetical protein